LTLSFAPLTPERWDDFVRLFGPSGAYSGCWCMYWRVARSEWQANGTAGNKTAMRALVFGGHVPGILAYRDGDPVGWCAIAPRQATPGLDRSPNLKPVDGAPVWSITCFFVAKSARGTGVARKLVEAALDYARDNGAAAIEAYPVDKPGKMQPVSSYMGVPSLFLRAGFVEVARRKPSRPVLRQLLV
jgi:GNAT superfamily N-acetyltransferase